MPVHDLSLIPTKIKLVTATPPPPRDPPKGWGVLGKEGCRLKWLPVQWAGEESDLFKCNSKLEELNSTFKSSTAVRKISPFINIQKTCKRIFSLQFLLFLR